MATARIFIPVSDTTTTNTGTQTPPRKQSPAGRTSPGLKLTVSSQHHTHSVTPDTHPRVQFFLIALKWFSVLQLTYVGQIIFVVRQLFIRLSGMSVDCKYQIFETHLTRYFEIPSNLNNDNKFSDIYVKEVQRFQSIHFVIH